MKKQGEIIKQMTDKELLTNLYASQAFILLLAFVLGLFMFDSWKEFFQLFKWDPYEIFVFGGGIAAVVIVLDVLLYKLVPRQLVDDGGINERVFTNRSVPHIFIIALLVAASEEILFRGVLQTQFGYVIASILFAVIHIRYLSKFILFIVTIMLSFLLGGVFLYTENLLVVIFIHFMIDFILGVLISKRRLL